MLRELAITRFVLIEELRLSFEPGLTVITGETGAGKSMAFESFGGLAEGVADRQLTLLLISLLSRSA